MKKIVLKCSLPPRIEDYQKRVAHIAIDGGTLRNQGAPGVAKTARDFLSKIALAKFVKDDETSFLKELDRQTELLRNRFPKDAKNNYGAARKAINLFLHEAFYHRVLYEKYGLREIEAFLELPLDGQVGKYLSDQAREGGEPNFPCWQTIKSLTSETNRRYQDFARVHARKMGSGCKRIQLEVKIWERSS